MWYVPIGSRVFTPSAHSGGNLGDKLCNFIMIVLCQNNFIINYSDITFPL